MHSAAIPIYKWFLSREETSNFPNQKSERRMIIL